MATTDELLDDLMKNYKKPEALIGENGLLDTIRAYSSVKREIRHSGKRK